MEEAQNKYSVNDAKFYEVSKMFSNVSDISFYSTQIKIAAREYANYLNEVLLPLASNIGNTNTGTYTGGTFVVKRGGRFIVNEKFVQKSIKLARDKGIITQFSFSNTNIVLDKLKEALAARN